MHVKNLIINANNLNGFVHYYYFLNKQNLLQFNKTANPNLHTKRGLGISPIPLVLTVFRVKDRIPI